MAVWEKNIPDRESRKCQGQKVGVCLLSVASIAEGDRYRGQTETQASPLRKMGATGECEQMRNTSNC